MNDNANHSGGLGVFLGSRAGLVLIAFLLIAGYLLWTEHEAHVIAGLGYLPYLLLLACPLLHFFMHGKHSDGHGGHDHGSHRSAPRSTDGSDAP